MKIKITVSGIQFEGMFNNTACAWEVEKNLPMDGEVNKWGDEIFFAMDISFEANNAVREVEVGDICYWPEGKAICIFFGRTPVSTGDKPIAANPVNVIGKITSDNLPDLKKSKIADRITIEDYGYQQKNQV